MTGTIRRDQKPQPERAALDFADDPARQPEAQTRGRCRPSAAPAPQSRMRRAQMTATTAATSEQRAESEDGRADYAKQAATLPPAAPAPPRLCGQTSSMRSFPEGSSLSRLADLDPKTVQPGGNRHPARLRPAHFRPRGAGKRPFQRDLSGLVLVMNAPHGQAHGRYGRSLRPPRSSLGDGRHSPADNDASAVPDSTRPPPAPATARTGARSERSDWPLVGSWASILAHSPFLPLAHSPKCGLVV